jgi:hypothetical protein
MASFVPHYCLSKRGKENLVHEGYTYNLHKQNQDGSQQWRCVNRGVCSAMMRVGPANASGERQVLEKPTHACLPNWGHAIAAICQK